MKERLGRAGFAATGASRLDYTQDRRSESNEHREIVTKAMYGDEKDALAAMKKLIQMVETGHAKPERVAWVVKNCENESVAFEGFNFLTNRNEFDELGFVGQFAGFKSIRDATLKFVMDKCKENQAYSKYISLIAEHTRYEDTQEDAINALLALGDFHRLASVVKYAEKESARLSAFGHLKAHGEHDKIRHLAEVCEDPAVRAESLSALVEAGRVEEAASVAMNGRFLDSAIAAFDFVYSSKNTPISKVVEITAGAHMRKVQLRGVERLSGDLFQLAKVFELTKEQMTKDACMRSIGSKEPVEITKALCSVKEKDEKNEETLMAAAMVLVSELAKKQEKEMLLEVQEKGIQSISDIARVKLSELENPELHREKGWLYSGETGVGASA